MGPHRLKVSAAGITRQDVDEVFGAIFKRSKGVSSMLGAVVNASVRLMGRKPIVSTDYIVKAPPRTPKRSLADWLEVASREPTPPPHRRRACSSYRRRRTRALRSSARIGSRLHHPTSNGVVVPAHRRGGSGLEKQGHPVKPLGNTRGRLRDQQRGAYGEATGASFASKASQ